jgi:AcrR family transcriptional regulator
MASDKREALLTAAEHAILTEGFAGASTRRIAREAGVPLSLLHYYFGGREGLLVALVERARDRTREAVHDRLAGPGSPVERAAAGMAVARDGFLADSGSVRLLLELAVAALHNERLHAEVVRLYKEAMQPLSRMADDLLGGSGRGDATPARPEAIASLLLGASLGLALQRMLGVDRRVTEEALDALGALLFGRLISHPVPADP